MAPSAPRRASRALIHLLCDPRTTLSQRTAGIRASRPAVRAYLSHTLQHACAAGATPAQPSGRLSPRVVTMADRSRVITRLPAAPGHGSSRSSPGREPRSHLRPGSTRPARPASPPPEVAPGHRGHCRRPRMTAARQSRRSAVELCHAISPAAAHGAQRQPQTLTYGGRKQQLKMHSPTASFHPLKRCNFPIILQRQPSRGLELPTQLSKARGRRLARRQIV